MKKQAPPVVNVYWCTRCGHAVLADESDQVDVDCPRCPLPVFDKSLPHKPYRLVGNRADVDMVAAVLALFLKRIGWKLLGRTPREMAVSYIGDVRAKRQVRAKKKGARACAR